MEQRKWKKEIANEKICDQCGSDMKEIKRPRTRKKYGKHMTTYECTFCNHVHRKRTQNEILRDLGERY